MRLTKHSDYALRILLYVATHPDRLVATEEIGGAYGISSNHLVKIVGDLGKLGILEVKRGRQGGVRLARAPETIVIGEIIRRMEPDLDLVECFNPETNTCPLIKVCGLTRALAQARAEFLRVLDSFTLADVADPKQRAKYRQLLRVID